MNRRDDPAVNITDDRITIEQGDNLIVLDDRQAAVLASNLAVAPHVLLTEEPGE